MFSFFDLIEKYRLLVHFERNKSRWASRGVYFLLWMIYFLVIYDIIMIELICKLEFGLHNCRPVN